MGQRYHTGFKKTSVVRVSDELDCAFRDGIYPYESNCTELGGPGRLSVAEALAELEQYLVSNAVTRIGSHDPHAFLATLVSVAAKRLFVAIVDSGFPNSEQEEPMDVDSFLSLLRTYGPDKFRMPDIPWAECFNSLAQALVVAQKCRDAQIAAGSRGDQPAHVFGQVISRRLAAAFVLREQGLPGLERMLNWHLCRIDFFENPKEHTDLDLEIVRPIFYSLKIADVDGQRIAKAHQGCGTTFSG